MDRIEISLLGPFRIQMEGKTVEGLTSPKIQALVAYLALDPDRAHSRQALATLLWPESPPAQALQNLRKSLSRLRKALPSISLLAVTRQSVRFNPRCECRVDAAALSTALEFSRSHNHPGGNLAACSECALRLASVIDLYRGDFLHGAAVDSAPFDDWALLKTEWLRREALEALDRLAEFGLATGQVDDAYRYAWRQVELDPYRERAYRLAMRALATGGQRNQALELYERITRLLKDELYVQPALKTTRLYEQIRDGVLTAAPRPSTPARHLLLNLPAQHTPFTGREAELARIDERLRDPNCHLLTLVGMGGVGKSRLAVQYALQARSRFRDGVCFVPLAPLQDPERVPGAIIAALQIKDLSAPGDEARWQQLLERLQEKHLLLILDNCEHVLSAAPRLAELANRAPQVKLLATSRQPLGLWLEWLLDIQGLPYPPEHGAAAVESYPAVQVFQQCARRQNTALQDASATAQIARICRLVEGLPLGIELAAAQLRQRSPIEIAAGIAADLDVLATEAPDLPARHRSLRAVFDHSWALLDSHQKMALAACSVFRGAFSREAAAAVCQADEGLLAELERASLLLASRQGYELHSLVRQFASENLADDPHQARQAEQAHGEYYLGMLRQAEPRLNGLAVAEATVEIDLVLDDLRAAWRWAISNQCLSALADGMGGLARYYVLRSQAQEGAEAFRAAAWAVRPLAEARPSQPVYTALDSPASGQRYPLPVLLGELLIFAARLEARRSGPDGALAAVEEGVQLAQAGRAPRAQAMGYLFWGVFLTQAGRLNEARTKLTSALDLATGVGWKKMLSDSLRGLGNTFLMDTEAQTARDYYLRSLPLSREIGDLRGTSATLGNLGAIYRSLGQPEAAQRFLEQALAIHEDLDDRSSLAQTLVYLGQLDEDRGRLKQAEARYRRSLETCLEIGARPLEAEARLHLGRLWARRGRPREAAEAFQLALSAFRQAGDGSGERAARAALEALPDLDEESNG